MSDEKLPQETPNANPNPENAKYPHSPTTTNEDQQQAERPDAETENGKLPENLPADSEKRLEDETGKEADGDTLEAAMIAEKEAGKEVSGERPLVAETNEAPDSEEIEDEEEVASSEDDEENDDAVEEQRDYSKLSDKELVAELEKLLKTRKIQDLKHDVEEIRSEFNGIFNEELEHKKEEFLAEGGNIIDFKFTSPLKKQFNSLYFDYKEKRNNYYKNLKRDLQTNLDRRWELIEELKGLLSAEENINTTYKHFKEIQEKWHLAGAIPRDKYNTVWNTYHHHVENFYDFLHLNREFRDLDFKHNLDSKLKLINRAEELTQEADVNKAFRELQMLHKMWKEDIGPVAKEYRDEVWDKFSEATKIIHDKRQAQMAEMEKDFEANYETKMQLVENIKKATEAVKPSHQGWQQAIKQVQELRDAFFNTGRVPRTQTKEIWKAFKEATGNFNHQKNSFYKNQKKEQYTNLEKKRELIKIAEEHKDSEDFEATTALMKKIQDDWKKIGHVPRKDSDRVWKQFKKACNHYFDRLHAQKNEANKEEMLHFETKQTLLQELGAIALTGDHKADVRTIKEKITAWKKVGRVPYNKRQIEQKFNQTLDELFSKLDLSKKESELIKFDNKLNTLVNREDDRKLQNEHFFISKKIDETKDEIRQLENNLGFFHHVDENNPLVKEVHKNIARHKEQLEVWKAKLSKIKEIRE